jgi:hypothetical protein
MHEPLNNDGHSICKLQRRHHRHNKKEVELIAEVLENTGAQKIDKNQLSERSK